ncbi:MAG TPA: hypothetical protein VHF05_01260 [Candidatus Paceibacterota bacterium]|jgi:hypothetical protein|nr:hypothetical protein [Candidatus Paceibacterota bacterium]
MKIKTAYYILAGIVFLFAIMALFLVSWMGKLNNNMISDTTSSTTTGTPKTYHSDKYGIEFEYPENVRIDEGQNMHNSSLDIGEISYYSGVNTDPKGFGIRIATTTVQDVSNLEFDYQKGVSKDNPEIQSIKITNGTTPVIESSEIITVAGKQALKEVISDGNTLHPSESTWVHIINNGKLYSLYSGISHGYDGTPYAATPQDEATVQQYLNLFLSTVKFF